MKTLNWFQRRAFDPISVRFKVRSDDVEILIQMNKICRSIDAWKISFDSNAVGWYLWTPKFEQMIMTSNVNQKKGKEKFWVVQQKVEYDK